MKRFIALILAVMMIAALLCACGDSSDPNRTVKTTVSAKYDDGFAKGYATSTSTDANGNTTYEFTGEKYNDFVRDYNNTVSETIKEDIVKNHDSSFGQFAYINVEKGGVIIGLNPGEYDAAYAEAEAPAYAGSAFSFFQSIENPASSVKVIYCNANNQEEVYGEFTIPIE